MSERHSTNGAAPEAAVGYYRMSTTAQEASIPQQRDWARPASQQAGYELVREFADEGVPGSEVERRADLQALIEFFESRHRQKRPVRGLFVWDMDRLSRATSIRTAAILDRLTQAGLTHIHTADEVYDLEEDLDLVLLNLKQDLTKAAYAKAIGKNVLRARQARARAGLWPGSPVPLGYVLGDDGHLAVDPEWADVIRWIYDRYADTADSLADVCRRLNNDPAARKPPSGEWSPNAVHRILTHPVYTGTLTYGARSCGKYYRNEGGQVVRVKGNAGRKTNRRSAKGSAIVVEGAHEAIVDRATFDAVARKLAANRWKRTTPIPGGGAWVLSGIAYCGCCGRRLVGTTQLDRRRRPPRVYRRLFCPGHRDLGTGCATGYVLQDVVLEELAALVKEEFGKPARVERVGRQIEKLLAAKEGEDARRREALAAKLAALDAQLPTAARRLLLLSEEEFPGLQREYAAMQREREQLDAELNSTEEARQVSREDARRMQDALADLGRLEEVIAERPPELVRDLLARIVEKVTLHFGEPGEPDACGHRRRPLDHIEVTFRPEVAHLFGAGPTTR
jgi:DNA invertase Pin-like site-specific DNA recombinase